MLKSTKAVLLLMTMILFISGCDRRNSVSRYRITPSFSADVTIVRDLSTGYNSADISFKRSGEPFSDAVIRIGNDTIPNAGGEYYYINDPQFSLSAGTNVIYFESPEDNYSQSISITIPGDFGIAQVSPRINSAATDVYVAWAQSSGASKYLLVVATNNYGLDGTSPYFSMISAQDSSLFVPYTTFENSIGEVIDAVYYIYVIAFNEGFGQYIRADRNIPMPDNLPERTISDPGGVIRYGTVAPVDSIIVSP